MLHEPRQSPGIVAGSATLGWSFAAERRDRGPGKRPAPEEHPHYGSTYAPAGRSNGKRDGVARMVTISILAFAMITAPPSAPAPVIDAAAWPTFRTALREQAIRCEILDPREERLSRLDQFGADLTTLRQRHRDLRNAPPLADALRFPNRRQVSEMLQFNQDYRKHLKERQVVDLYRGSVFKDAIRETDDLYHVWDLV